MNADFTRVEPVRQLAKDAVEFLGGLDVLINNAGITVNIPFEDVLPEQFDTLFHVNIRAQFFLTQQCYRRWCSKGKGPLLTSPPSTLSPA